MRPWKKGMHIAEKIAASSEYGAESVTAKLLRDPRFQVGCAAAGAYKARALAMAVPGQHGLRSHTESGFPTGSVLLVCHCGAVLDGECWEDAGGEFDQHLDDVAGQS